MRQQDKKELRKIKKVVEEAMSMLEALCDDHQEWMDERSDEVDGWDNTPTGERASDDQYNLDDWKDTLETMIDEMEENV